MGGEDDVVVDDAAVRRHGEDVHRVLDEDADVVDPGKQERDERRHEEYPPLQILPENDGHEECVEEDEAGGVPATRSALWWD